MGVAAIQEADSVKVLCFHHKQWVFKLGHLLVIYKEAEVLPQMLGDSELRWHEATPVAVCLFGEYQPICHVLMLILVLLAALCFWPSLRSVGRLIL